jgi:hypothetical protein
MIIIIHSEIALKIEKIWNIYKNIVRREFQTVILRIHISLNIWIFPNRWLFLAIYAHFTIYYYKRQKAFLALQKMSNHNKEN